MNKLPVIPGRALVLSAAVLCLESGFAEEPARLNISNEQDGKVGIHLHGGQGLHQLQRLSNLDGDWLNFGDLTSELHWPNRDLNVGAIINLAPDVSAFTNVLQVGEATVRTVLQSWGPGKFDASLLLDGKAFRPDGKSGATLLPAAFGLAGVNLATYTGWGSVTHWNGFVANLEMQGQGVFYDPRLNDATTFPIAARIGSERRASSCCPARSSLVWIGEAVNLS